MVHCSGGIKTNHPDQPYTNTSGSPANLLRPSMCTQKRNARLIGLWFGMGPVL